MRLVYQKVNDWWSSSKGQVGEVLRITLKLQLFTVALRVKQTAFKLCSKASPCHYIDSSRLRLDAFKAPGFWRTADVINTIIHDVRLFVCLFVFYQFCNPAKQIG